MTKAEQAARHALILEMRRNGATIQQIADKFAVTRQYAGRLCEVALRGDDDPDVVKGEPCPRCGCSSKTLETRRRASKGYTYRRHECLSCHHRWPSRQANAPKRNATYSADTI